MHIKKFTESFFSSRKSMITHYFSYIIDDRIYDLRINEVNEDYYEVIIFPKEMKKIDMINSDYFPNNINSIKELDIRIDRIKKLLEMYEHLKHSLGNFMSGDDLEEFEISLEHSKVYYVTVKLYYTSTPDDKNFIKCEGPELYFNKYKMKNFFKSEYGLEMVNASLLKGRILNIEFNEIIGFVRFEKLKQYFDTKIFIFPDDNEDEEKKVFTRISKDNKVLSLLIDGMLDEVYI